MSEDVPPSRRPRRPVRTAPPTRKLSFPSRVRGSFRRGADRVLGADAGWSLGFVVVMVALLGSQRCGMDYGSLVVGEIAREEIRAKYDINLPDVEETEARRAEARRSIPDVYVLDRERGSRLTRELAKVFEEGRRAFAETGQQPEESGEAPPKLALRLGTRTVDALRRAGFSPEVEEALASAVRRVMSGLVIGNKALLERAPEVIVVHVPGDREERLSDYSGIIDLDEARKRVRAAVRASIEAPRDDEAALADLGASFVDANLNLDPEGTQARREAAAADVPPVLEKVARGTVLVPEGHKITPEIFEQLQQARDASRGRLGLVDLVGLVVVVSLLGFFLFRYASYHQRHFKKIRHLHALLILMMTTVLLLAQGLMWLTGEVVDRLAPPFNHLPSYYYLVPLGAGSIMIALLANGRIATVYSVFSALLFGAMAGWDPFLMTWALLVQLAGVYGISTYRERAALLRAGIVVGVVGAGATLALLALQGNLEPASQALYAACLAFVGGAVGVGLLVSFMLPMLESMFRVLTDVRLLELSNSSNPLLSELAVKAPGSYNHSLVVGHLAEDAARAIGANALFCRVAAFYHDIGKLLKPEYYVENQRSGNPHDKLAPSMSALVVAAHVKDGVKLAREAGLPEQIIDIIPQHHGTRLMSFFYRKAKDSSDPSMGPIKEEDFRYPGPKPQTREAAIFMLADAVEAAARTVDDPTRNRLREVIRKVSNAIVLEGQFEECDLTFVDLDRIQQAFLRTLVSMYHHRVDYPGFDFGRSKAEARGGPTGSGRRLVRSG